MRRTRFMSLFFLVLALAFFCLRAFRQGYELPFMLWKEVRSQGNSGMPSAAEYDRWARESESAHDAAGSAFVALHHPDPATRKRLAEEAVKADPKLTWIYFNLATILNSNDQQ